MSKAIIDLTRLVSIIKNAVTMVYDNIMVHDASTGHIKPGPPAAGEFPVGAFKDIGVNTGLASDLVGDGTNTGVTQGAYIKRDVTVVGASALTDRGKPVYMTDINAFTLTKPAAGGPIGFVWEWKSATTCDVYIMNLVDTFNRTSAGRREIMPIANIHTSLLEGTAAADLKVITAQRKFKIISLHAQPMAIDSGLVAGAQTLNLEINTTNLTGGVLSLGFGDADAIGDVGTEIDATAITGANEVDPGDVITLELVASGTGFTAAKHGIFDIYAVIELQAGE